MIAVVRLGAIEPFVVGDAPAPESLFLTFVGDIMHHDVNASMPDYDELYRSVRSVLSRDDLSFANIEFPVDPSRAPSGYPKFNGTVDYIHAAIRSGFDVFSLANNHTFDWGRSSADATLASFDAIAEETGTFHNGIRPNPGYTLEPTVIHKNGWTIGFLSLTAFSNVPGAAAHVHQVDYHTAAGRKRVMDAVASMAARFDLLVVSVHAGTEYVLTPDPAKTEFFRDLVDAGADIVWGHHPHVLQPYEIVETDGGNRLIMYSTGNFVSGQRRYQQPLLALGRWAPTGDTALFQVQVARAGDDSSVGAVRTPVITVLNHPEYGLVLRTFGEVMAEQLSIQWRSFYLVRYAVMRSYRDAALPSSAHQSPAAD